MASIQDLDPVTEKRGPTWWREIVFKAIIKRDGAICYFCEKPFETSDFLHCHHKWPVKRGGIDDLDNLVLAHHSCHLRFHAKLRRKITAYIKF